jgi:hypothetical protein
MSEEAANVFGVGLVAVILITCAAISSTLGSVWREKQMLTTYCQSLNYISYTKLDGLYYCYDSDGLEAIDWMNK